MMNILNTWWQCEVSSIIASLFPYMAKMSSSLFTIKLNKNIYKSNGYYWPIGIHLHWDDYRLSGIKFSWYWVGWMWQACECFSVQFSLNYLERIIFLILETLPFIPNIEPTKENGSSFGHFKPSLTTGAYVPGETDISNDNIEWTLHSPPCVVSKSSLSQPALPSGSVSEGVLCRQRNTLCAPCVTDVKQACYRDMRNCRWWSSLIVNDRGIYNILCLIKMPVWYSPKRITCNTHS